MTVNDILGLIEQGESETLEFKKSTNLLDEAFRTLCAFLNGTGGKVVIGVAGNRLLGQDVSDSTLREIATKVREIEPAGAVELEEVKNVEDGRSALVLFARPNTGLRPYVYRGRPFERIGSTTSQMTQSRYQQLLLQRAYATDRWETTIAHDRNLNDLDEGLIQSTIRLAEESGRLTGVAGESPPGILARLGLIREDGVLQAAIAVFGIRFPPEYPQCRLRLARFAGTTKSEFLDQRQLTGNAFALLEEAQFFLRRHLQSGSYIAEGRLERIERPDIPPIALREALVNAFCHRDYSNVDGAVDIAVFDDRVEIWNPGTLPHGLTVADLKGEHMSRPRNPLIAEIFYLRGLVEQWGRGTQRIVELCVNAGQREPDFIAHSGQIGVRFNLGAYVPPSVAVHELTLRQREILEILSAGPARLRDIAAKLKDPPADTTVYDDLRTLRRLGLVDKYGTMGPGARWGLAS